MLWLRMNLRGMAYGLVSVVIWGVTFVNTKTLLTDFNSFEILFVRFAAAYGALWLICPFVFSVVACWRLQA